ncbi:MAG: hypothetical protein LUH49_04470 [Cloacibacillus porcorum]|uniref:helix-turn-helix transcriptional regulator n=1 Tax=Cloacibacillus porcorum TaxID=1197717 RepID=UPI0023F1FD0A|nr:hypothetical protein [Cloacibacillus porcorum]MCD7876214.1 hypothetical protein [Cloacibacillus porcorum]
MGRRTGSLDDMGRVRRATVELIERVCSGRYKDSSEVAVLPDVLAYYERACGGGHVPVSVVACEDVEVNEFAGLTKEQGGAPTADSFPQTGLVSAAQIAPFLGFTKETHKRPENSVHRLAANGDIPKPVYQGSRMPRWRAEDIREYARTRKYRSEDE